LGLNLTPKTSLYDKGHPLSIFTILVNMNLQHNCSITQQSIFTSLAQKQETMLRKHDQTTKLEHICSSDYI